MRREKKIVTKKRREKDQLGLRRGRTKTAK
jgi:hypothetical protein